MISLFPFRQHSVFGMILRSRTQRSCVCVCVCGETNTLNHSLIYKKGGYISMRHNSLITKLLVIAGCRDVVTEPLLLPTAGVTLPPRLNTADNARADVSARSIWNPFERAFLDVRVYHALSSLQQKSENYS